MAFGHTGDLFVVARKSEIEIWDLKAQKQLRVFSATRQEPAALVIAPDGKKLATFDADRTIRIRDLASGIELSSIRVGENSPKSPVRFMGSDIAFSPDLRLAATCEHIPVNEAQGLIHIWDLFTGKERMRLPQGGKGLVRLAFSPDGRTLLATGRKDMNLWELASGELRHTVAVLNKLGVDHMAYSPDKRHIAFSEQELLGSRGVAFGSQIHIYDIIANRFVSNLLGHEGAVSSLAFSPDGRFLASGSADLTGLLWDIAALSGPNASTPLTAPERIACWADLAGTAQDAFSSMWKLVADKEAVSFLRENLSAAPAPASQKEIQRWVADLGSDQVAVRTQAAKALTKIGPAAEEGLRKSIVPGLPLETHRRMEEILRAITRQQLRSVRAVEVLEMLNTEAARNLLAALAQGYEAAWQTREAKASLDRLAFRAR